MIFVDRSEFLPPQILIRFQHEELERLSPLFSQQNNQRVQQRPEFFNTPVLRNALLSSITEIFNGKCAYCERPAATVDLFRPRWRASRLNNQTDSDHYWWLASDWHNQYLCCHECNSRKANLFPILGQAAKPLTFGSDLREEKPLLIDPCDDDPELHLRFLSDGTVIPLSDRGAFTIKIFQLNQPNLIRLREERAVWTTHICNQLWSQQAPSNVDPESFKNTLKSHFSLGTPHLAAVRAAINKFIDAQTGTLVTVPPPQITPPPQLAELPDIVWLEKIEISNFKVIDELNISFPKPDESSAQKGQPWLMVLGENSVGKSSLLQAVALALMPDDDRVKQVSADDCLSRRTGVTEGYVLLTFSNTSQRKLSFSKGNKKFLVDGKQPSIPVLAYGSTRLLPGKRERKPQKPAVVSVQNLFEHTHPLANVERYLCDKDQVTDDRFDLLATSLKGLLPVDSEAKIKRTKSYMSSKVNDKNMSLSELSDGYKSVLALAMDIMFHLTNSSFDMESAQGLVMVDELELHLHPRWKIRIVEQLRTLFPRVRFITSTHDPLCVQGLQKGELHVMARNPKSQAFMIEAIDVPHGTRTDEVLTGPWFGLTSTMDSETLELISEHSNLLQRPERTDTQEKRMHDLDIILNKRMGTFGNTRAQRAALAAAAVLDDGIPAPHSDQLIRQRLSRFMNGASEQPSGKNDA